MEEGSRDEETKKNENNLGCQWKCFFQGLNLVDKILVLLTFLSILMSFSAIYTRDYFLPGGILAGTLVGFHFFGEIKCYLRNLQESLESQKVLNVAVLACLVLYLFLAAPAAFVGMVVGVGLFTLFKTR